MRTYKEFFWQQFEKFGKGFSAYKPFIGKVQLGVSTFYLCEHDFIHGNFYKRPIVLNEEMLLNAISRLYSGCRFHSGWNKYIQRIAKI